MINIEITGKLFKLCAIFCFVVLFLSFLYTLGYRLNISDSLPHRIYKITDISDKTIFRSDYVVINCSVITNNPVVIAGLERGYLTKHPMIKQIGAVPGDEVLLQDDRIYINGKDYGSMKVLSKDSQGNSLSPYPTLITLQSNQYWLISNPDRGFDSRYFGWISRDCISHVAVPVF